MTEEQLATLVEIDQRSKSNSHRLDELVDEVKDLKNENKAIYRIATSVELMAQKIAHIEEKVDETGRKVDAQTALWREAENKLSDRIAEVDSKPDRLTASNVNSIKVSLISSILSILASGLVAAIIAFAK